MKNRRSPFSQLKTALIFPGSQWKTAEAALVRTYEGSVILSCTTSSGYRVGLLFGAGQPSAVKPCPPAPGTRYLIYFLGAFTNIHGQAHAMLPWLPKSVVRLFIRERFDNVSKICRVSCPIFIGHGTRDELVPFAMSERLAQAARPRKPVTFLLIEGGTHKGLFEASRGSVWTAIKDFLSSIWQSDIH